MITYSPAPRFKALLVLYSHVNTNSPSKQSFVSSYTNPLYPTVYVGAASPYVITLSSAVTTNSFLLTVNVPV